MGCPPAAGAPETAVRTQTPKSANVAAASRIISTLLFRMASALDDTPSASYVKCGELGVGELVAAGDQQPLRLLRPRLLLAEPRLERDLLRGAPHHYTRVRAVVPERELRGLEARRASLP